MQYINELPTFGQVLRQTMLRGAQIAVSGGGMQHRNETLLRTIRSASLFPPHSGLFCACRCATHRRAPTVSAHCGSTGHRSRMAWQSLAAVARGRQRLQVPLIAHYSVRSARHRFPHKSVVVPWGAAHMPYVHSHLILREVCSDTSSSEANSPGTYQATGLCFCTSSTLRPLRVPW